MLSHELNQRRPLCPKNSNQELIDRIDEATLRTAIGLQNARDTLPILHAAREEQQHTLNLIDSLVDKLLDLAKLFITVSMPALVTLYFLKSDDFNSGFYIFISALVFVSGITIFIFGMWYKQKYLPTYLDASTARLDL